MTPAAAARRAPPEEVRDWEDPWARGTAVSEQNLRAAAIAGMQGSAFQAAEVGRGEARGWIRRDRLMIQVVFLEKQAE
jgi:hypothetical protein